MFDNNELLNEYVRLLVSSPHNLTAVSDIKTAFHKHIDDVLIPLRTVSPVGRCLDIGTGGGVPGLVCAIAFPETEWTLIDSIGKKIEQVKLFIRDLGLKNAGAFVTRAEELALERRAKFDSVFFRGVSRADICMEYSRPFLKSGGRIFLYKGPSWSEEIEFAELAAQKLGFSFFKSIDYELYDGSKRKLVIYEATGDCPAEFPRRVGVAKKRPLGGI